MLEQERPGVGEDRWRGAVAVVAIGVLMLSFATRFGAAPDIFWAPNNSHSHAERSVDRRSVEPERQHFDRDAAEWASPSAAFSMVYFTAPEASPVSEEAQIPAHMFTGRPYVRPPPSAQSLC